LVSGSLEVPRPLLVRGTKMNVLIAHNSYLHRGGEDSVVDAEAQLLTRHGHSVEIFERKNEEISEHSKALLAVHAVWSRGTVQQIEERIDLFKPAVIHVHNTLPLISPSLYWAAARKSIPVVQTLHNFRLLCTQAMFLREGKICEDCLGKVPWRGAIRGCYRGSKLQSTVLTSTVVVHRAIGTWQNKITRYIALNEFCRSKFIQGGLPAERIVIKPNFVDHSAPVETARSNFLFVGRLSSEKGVETLAKAVYWAGSVQVRVAGTGPETEQFEGVQGVKLLGGLSVDEVRTEMSNAMALVLPSIWYENFPRTLVEAFACGLPVIASRIGALAELVTEGVTGLLFEPGNPHDLAVKMKWAMSHPAEMAVMGKSARALYEAEFTAERNYQQLMDIYKEAIEEVCRKNEQ